MSPIPEREIKGSLISYFSNLVKLNGGINLAQGIPGFEPPAELLKSLSEVSFKNVHQYAPGTGNSELVAFLRDKYHTADRAAQILITNGATEAISLIYNYLMSITAKSEFNVAAFSPAYESYIHLPRIFGHNFFSYRIDEENYFDDSEFEHFFIENNIKVLFVASPGNPYGKAISKAKLDFLINLAEANGAYLIVDSVYDELFYRDGMPYFPSGKLSPNVFYINSFSKKFSITGWRVGYFLMHDSHYTRMCYTHDYIGLCAPAPFQQAIADFLKSGNYNLYIDDLRKKVTDNYFSVVHDLSGAGFSCPVTDGGYFVWSKLPHGFNDSLKFGLDLYESSKTAIIPGVHFGEEWNNYIRINVAREREELDKGIQNILSFVEEKKIHFKG